MAKSRTWPRRSFLQSAGIAAGGLTLGAPHIVSSSAAPGKPERGIKLALVLSSKPHERWRLARQIGVNHAITGVSREIRGVDEGQFVPCLRAVKEEFSRAGLTVAGLEGNQIDFTRIKLGAPGRERDIARFCRLIEAMGAVGIPMLCYNFMVGIGWYRTRVDIEERGGALTSGFDNTLAEQQGLTEIGQVSEEAVWHNYRFFIERVVPVAEKSRVQLALHPDDPPLSPLRGIGRIFTSSAAFQKAMDLAPSPYNGLTFCQANFKAMGEDIAEAAREFGGRKKIFFIHFRDIRGSGKRFQETFHDNGPTDMAQMMKLYHDIGFHGPVRPDHAPTLEGESNNRPGYAMSGKIFAVGYMKGILDALDIPAL